MTVRVKILAISAVLLLLFAIVLIGSMVMQMRSGNKVAAIIEFHLPLAAVISDLDVATDEYELIVDRVLRRPEPGASVEADLRSLDRVKTRIASNFERADALIERALADPRIDASDRVVFARVQRSLLYLRRLQAPFIDLGEKVMAAAAAGRTDEARGMASG